MLLSNTYSQNNALPFKAAVAIGPSFPVGKFSKTTPDSNTTQSAAKPGPLVTVSIAYQFKKSSFGVEILGGWQQNNVNDLAIARDMARRMPVGTETLVKTGNWHVWKILAGPIFEIPLAKNGKTSFQCETLGGVLKTTIPSFAFVEIYNNPPSFYSAGIGEVPLAVTFCYQIDAGIQYRITRFLSLSGNLGFMHATSVYSYTKYLDPPYYQMPVHVSQSYPISTINLLVGLAYAF